MDKLNKIVESYPVELKLLLVCCGSERWNLNDLLPQIEWNLFYKWMCRHRLTPAVYRFIKNNPEILPEDVKNKIDERYARITKKNLRIVRETIFISERLRETGIKAIPFKGIVLSQQIFNNFNEREIRDIDILVEPSRLNDTLSVLEKDGYIIQDLKQRNRFNAKNKNISHLYPVLLKKSDTAFSLEVHFRLFPWNGLGKNLNKSFFFPNETINIQGNVMPAPQVEQHMEFNTYHGVKHLWSGLQWMLDYIQWYKIPEREHQNTHFESNKCYALSENIYSLLFKKSTFIKKQKGIKWITPCLNTIIIYDEKEMRTLRFKILFIKLASWMNNNSLAFYYYYFREQVSRYL